MKLSGIPFARVFAVLAMVLSLASLTGLSAAAAPGISAPSGMDRAQAGGIAVDLTAEICRGLDGDLNGFVSTEEAGNINVDLNGDGLINAVDAELAAAGCPAVLVPFLDGATVQLCLDLDANGDGIVDDAEAANLVVDLNGDFAIDALDRAIVTGDCGGLLGGLPADGLGTGTVDVSAFACVDIAGAVLQAGVNADPGCEPGYALLTFYLVGDGTNAAAQLEVNGTGALELGAGQYEVVEETTGVRLVITIGDGQTTPISALLPAAAPAPGDGGAPAPAAPEAPADGGDAAPAAPAAPAAGGTTGGGGAVAVQSLPSTGSGQAADSQAWMLMAGAAVLSAVGFQITRRQVNS
jgi:hypothetical protein